MVTLFAFQMCIDLNSMYSDSNVELEYGYLRLAQSSTVPRAIPDLEIDDRLMETYHSVKARAADSE